MQYKIRIKSPEHSRKVQKHLFSLGYKWWVFESQTISHANMPILVFDSDDKRIYYFYRIYGYMKCFPEVELIETVSYKLKDVQKREVVTIGEKSYYKDELEIALKNIKLI